MNENEIIAEIHQHREALAGRAAMT